MPPDRRPVVLISSPIHPDGVALLDGCDRRECHHRPGVPPDPALLEVLAEAEAVIVRSLPMTEAMMAGAPRLRVIAKHGAGVNNIDIAAATARGILVTNTGDANAAAVAQLAVTLILAAQRRLVAVHASVAQGDFARHRGSIFPDLMGRTVGIVGFGSIGRIVARICRNGFDARILAFDPQVPAEEMQALGVEKVDDLDALVADVDALSLHVPLLPATHHLMSRDRLRRMRPHAVIVNTARGGVVDEAALIEALQEGWIAGAGLDVYEQEPPTNPALLAQPNVVLSPHIGGATEGSRRRAATGAATAVLDVLAGRRPAHLLNPAALAASSESTADVRI